MRAEALKRLLESSEGVTSADVNILTGSIVMRYDPAVTSGQALAEMLRGRGYLTSSRLTPPPAPARSLPSFGGELGGFFARKVLETAVERSVVALVAALL